MQRRWLLPLIILVVALVLAFLSCEEERSASPVRQAPTVEEVPAPVEPAAAPKPRERVRAPEPVAVEPPETHPAPEPAEPEFLPGDEGTVPDDVRGTGDATLHLRVVDAATLVPVEGRLVLWRIGAAVHGEWSPGDHIQAKMDLGEEAARIENLPPGTYRAHCEFARRGSEDPAAFSVSSGENEVTLRVAAPRSLPVRALLFTHDGAQIHAAMSRTSGKGSSSSRGPSAPDWTNVRRHATRTWNMGFGGRSGGSSGISTRPAKHDGSWFDLGTITEATRRANTRRTVVLTPAGGSGVTCLLRGHTIRPGAVFVGTSAPLADLVSAVTAADGSPVLEAGAAVRADTEGWLVDEDGSHVAGRGFEIAVRVELAGHEDLSFTWRVGDPWPVHRMVALPE